MGKTGTSSFGEISKTQSPPFIKNGGIPTMPEGIQDALTVVLNISLTWILKIKNMKRENIP